jgi:hypothetical protein
MQDIGRLLKKEIEANRLVEFDFIRSYVENYIKINKLKRYYKDLIPSVPPELLKANLISAYNAKTKNLHIDDDRLTDSIIKTTYLKDKNAYCTSDLIFIYSIYLSYITHELAHIKQNKLVHSFSYSPQVQLLKDAFTVHDKYYEFYLSNHNDFISEHNANMEAIFEVLDLLNYTNMLEDKDLLNQYNSFMCNLITKPYQAVENFMICPASTFYSNFKEKDRFYTLDKEMSKNNFTRILYGMPFDRKLFSKLVQVRDKEIEVPNVKKLILRSGEYGKTI